MADNLVSKIRYFPKGVLAFFILSVLLSKPIGAQEINTLENGLKVIIKEDHRNPIVVFSVFIGTGAAIEGEYLGSGISHLIEHMLFKGTKKYPAGLIEDILHKYGGDIDAWTSYDYTGFSITILKENKDIALDVLKEVLSSPLFNAEELKKEMQVIEREMDLGKDDPSRRISMLTFSTAYIRHPYRIPVIGYKENFNRLSRQDLAGFFESNYVPERMIMAIVGDIDTDTLFKDVEKIFGRMPRGKNTMPLLVEEPEQITQRYIEEKMDIDGSYLNIAFHSTSLLDRDIFALDILSFILGEGESSILNRKIRIEKALVLSISAYNYTPRDPGLFVISCVTKEESIRDVSDAVIKEVDLIKEGGISEEELVKAKNNFIAQYIYRKETMGSQAMDLALGELLTGNPRFFELYIERIKSVTLDEIHEAAKKYLRKENMTVTALTKSGNALNLDTKPQPQKNEREIKRVVLENKIPVLICEDKTLPIISIILLSKGGVLVETRQNNGISKLANLMLIDGTTSMTRKELTKFYESKAMSVSTYSANNSSGISVTCLKEQLEDALKLVSDICTGSIFPEKELEREKKEIISAIEMQDNEIFEHGCRLLKELIFKEHPYGFQIIGTKDSIGSITKDDIIRFHQNIFTPENMVLGICGDCDSDEIESLVKKYFYSVPLKKSEIGEAQKEPAMDETRQVELRVDKDQSLVLVAFNGIDIYDKDRYTVEVMVDTLASESGVFFKSIRGKAGLSYAQGAFQVLGIHPGYIVIYVLTSKKDIARVKDIIFKELELFIRNGVSEEAMQKSKNHLKSMRQIAMQVNSNFIFAASLDELYGLGYDNYKDYDINIDGVTVGDIKRAAKKILTLDKCAIAIIEGK